MSNIAYASATIGNVFVNVLPSPVMLEINKKNIATISIDANTAYYCDYTETNNTLMCYL